LVIFVVVLIYWACIFCLSLDLLTFLWSLQGGILELKTFLQIADVASGFW